MHTKYNKKSIYLLGRRANWRDFGSDFLHKACIQDFRHGIVPFVKTFYIKNRLFVLSRRWNPCEQEAIIPSDFISIDVCNSILPAPASAFCLMTSLGVSSKILQSFHHLEDCAIVQTSTQHFSSIRLNLSRVTTRYGTSNGHLLCRLDTDTPSIWKMWWGHRYCSPWKSSGYDLSHPFYGNLKTCRRLLNSPSFIQHWVYYSTCARHPVAWP